MTLRDHFAGLATQNESLKVLTAAVENLNRKVDERTFQLEIDQEKMQEHINFIHKGFSEIRDKLAGETKEEQSFNWNDTPIICEINGYRWYLGQEADEEMNWCEAVEWCKSVGGELPPREVLLMCYINEDIKPSFKTSWYWSSAEFHATSAWEQAFTNGDQRTNYKNSNYSVRAVKKVKI